MLAPPHIWNLTWLHIFKPILILPIPNYALNSFQPKPPPLSLGGSVKVFQTLVFPLNLSIYISLQASGKSPFFSLIMVENSSRNGGCKCSFEAWILCQWRGHLFHQEVLKFRGFWSPGFRIRLWLCEVKGDCRSWWAHWGCARDWTEAHTFIRTRPRLLNSSRVWMVVLPFVGRHQYGLIFNTSLYLKSQINSAELQN